jgi:hypothetical protein
MFQSETSKKDVGTANTGPKAEQQLLPVGQDVPTRPWKASLRTLRYGHPNQIDWYAVGPGDPEHCLGLNHNRHKSPQ